MPSTTCRFPRRIAQTTGQNWFYSQRQFAAIVSADSIVNISSAIFDCSAPSLDSCPDESLPEFAFIGRSNVGKSSLLNMFTGKENLARVSPTPGFTKLINFFTINKTWRLVDLPGYGFAEGARKDSARFNRAVLNYLEHRTNLCSVFALIESALPPQPIDIEFIEWLTRKAVPFVLVFTKSDKVLAKVAQANIAAFMEQISAWYEKPPASFSCSAETGEGRAELLAVIDEAMTAIAAEQRQSATAEPDRPQPRKPRPDRHRPW
jgi:GTP-binding protein